MAKACQSLVQSTTLALGGLQGGTTATKQSKHGKGVVQPHFIEYHPNYAPNNSVSPDTVGGEMPVYNHRNSDTYT